MRQIADGFTGEERAPASLLLPLGWLVCWLEGGVGGGGGGGSGGGGGGGGGG